jgi:hypothetical protein
MKSRIAMITAAINKTKTHFTSKLDLKFKEETSKVLLSEHSFVWCWNLETSERRSEIPGKLWNMVLEKDGEDNLDWSCKNEEVIDRVNEETNILPTIKQTEV